MRPNKRVYKIDFSQLPFSELEDCSVVATFSFLVRNKVQIHIVTGGLMVYTYTILALLQQDEKWRQKILLEIMGQHPCVCLSEQ